MILIKGWEDRRVQRNEALLCCPTPILTKDYSTKISSISVIITSPNAIAAFPSEPDIPESILFREPKLQGPRFATLRTPNCGHSLGVAASPKAVIKSWTIGEGRSALLVAAGLIWLANISFGLWRGFHDVVDGKRGQATIGIACVVGVNAVLGWMIYTAVVTSTDL